MIFLEGDKARAEVFRHTGYVLCSPFCLQILDQIIQGFKKILGIFPGAFLSIPLLIIGVLLVFKSIDILEQRNALFNRELLHHELFN
jgi:hypothetical protein